MWPRLAVFISPLERGGSVYRVGVRKGWWGGPGRGGESRVVAEYQLELSSKPTDDLDVIRELLRAAADAL